MFHSDGSSVNVTEFPSWSEYRNVYTTDVTPSQGVFSSTMVAFGDDSSGGSLTYTISQAGSEHQLSGN